FSLDEQYAIRRLKNSIQLEDGRMECDALWRRNEPQLPNNLAYAITRLRSLEGSKQMREPKNKEAFNLAIRKWVDAGYVRKVTGPDSWPREAFYLPIFAVCRPDKNTTKVRPVCDGRAKFNNKCLNDAVLPGPKLMNSLPEVMIRFKKLPVAVMGDIKEMFLHVSLAEPARKYHRFVHREHPDDPIEEYEFMVHCFGNAGSPAVAIYTIKMAAERFKEKYPGAAACILNSTVVD